MIYWRWWIVLLLACCRGGGYFFEYDSAGLFDADGSGVHQNVDGCVGGQKGGGLVVSALRVFSDARRFGGFGRWVLSAFVGASGFDTGRRRVTARGSGGGLEGVSAAMRPVK